MVMSRLRPRLLALDPRVTPTVFTVTNTLDSGSGSLRNAVINANKAKLADFIVFDPAVFTSAKTITLTSGQLLITDDVTITGPSFPLTVNGNGSSRVFEVNATGTIAVSMSKLTITGGLVAGPGAGVLSQAESLTLTDCVIQNNVTTGGNSGGGVSSLGGGTLTLVRCTVTGNSAGGNGGGVDANGGATVTLTDCTISKNTAAANGGGLGVGSSSLRVERSTVSGNFADRGGGLYFAGAIGPAGLTVLNSTFSGNKATVTAGGGIALVNVSGTLLVQNSTLTVNSAVTVGGGVARVGGTALISCESSVLQSNTAPAGPDVSTTGTFQAKNCAVGSGSGVTDLGGNLFGATIQLGPLGFNGGPTQTHLPASASLLVNAGSNPTGLTVDQRGTGFPRQSGPGIDMGAVEAVNPPPPAGFVVTTPADGGPGSLRQALLDANAAAPSHDTVSFDPAVFTSAQVIALSGEITITDAVTIVGPGPALAKVTGSTGNRVFNIDAPGVITVAISGLTLTGGDAVGAGGAVRVHDEAVTFSACVVAGNTSAFAGGGIAVETAPGSLTLLDCTVSNNTTATDGEGGGVAFLNGGSLLVERCTLSGNTAPGMAGRGGGLFFAGAAGPGGVTVSDSTVSGNTGGICSGGIGLEAFTGTLVVRNSTVTANVAGNAGGGGVELISGPGAINIASSVVAGNTSPFGNDDVRSSGPVAINSSAANVVTGAPLTGGGNLPPGTDLKLGPLAANGGPTLTHALLPFSPCINAGANPAALTLDQRGLPRTVGGQVDIGAIEVQALPPIVTAVVVNAGAAQRSMVTKFEVTFSETVTFPAGAAAAFQLTRTGPGVPTGAVNLSAVQSGPTVTLTFLPGGPVGLDTGGSLRDGVYQLTVDAGSVLGGAGALDGNADGVGGDDFVTPVAGAGQLHRLFGDADGDADTDAVDYAAFRAAFGGAANSAFDSDGDGDVDAADYGQFRSRFGSSV